MNPSAGDRRTPGARRGRRSLRIRVLLVVGGTMLLLLAILMTVCSLMIDLFFAGLQDRLTTEKIQRFAFVMGQLGQLKTRLVRDSAEWDETFDFIAGEDKDYLARNFGPEVNSSGQDVILVFDAQKKLIGAVTSVGESDGFQAPAGLDVPALARGGLLAEEPQAGLAADGDRVLLLASCPVLRSDRSGPSSGWLVFGTYFNPERMRELAQAAGADQIRFQSVAGPPPAAGLMAVPVRETFLGSGTGYFEPARSWRAGDTGSNIFVFIHSLAEAQGILAEVTHSLTVYASAVEAKNWIVAVSVFCGLAAMLFGVAAMESLVMKPLAALDHEIAGMAQAEQAVGLLKISRDDEIGRLAQSANCLLQRALNERQEVEAQRALLNSILDSANEGIEAYRPIRTPAGKIEDFELILLNRAAARICRLEESQVLGKRVFDSFPKLRSSGIFEKCVRVAESRQPQTFELYYEGHNVTAWLRLSVAPWNDGVVVTYDDVSERKNREQALQESFSEIERFNAAMIGREERVIEMKREVNELRARLGLPPEYDMKTDEA